MSQTTNTGAPSASGISFSSLKNLASLYFDLAKFNIMAQLATLFSSIAFVGTIMALGLICLVFVSIGIGHLLAMSIAPHLAYLLVAAFYLLLFVLAIALRRHLFYKPVSRFISRLLNNMSPCEWADSIKHKQTQNSNTLSKNKLQRGYTLDELNKQRSLTLNKISLERNRIDSTVRRFRERHLRCKNALQSIVNTLSLVDYTAMSLKLIRRISATLSNLRDKKNFSV